MNKIFALNDYLSNSDVNKEKVVIGLYPNYDVLTKLIVYYQAKKNSVIYISSCVNPTYRILPISSDIMDALDDKIHTTVADRIIVAGIEAYLSLLNAEQIDSFYHMLHDRIEHDYGDKDVFFAVPFDKHSSQFLQERKYANSPKILGFKGDVAPHFAAIHIYEINKCYVPTDLNYCFSGLNKQMIQTQYLLFTLFATM